MNTRNGGSLLGLLIASALMADKQFANGGFVPKAAPEPEMPAVLPEGVLETDTFRIIRHDDAQALLHRTLDTESNPFDDVPLIKLKLSKMGGDMPDLELVLQYTSTKLRDIDFFRFDTAMVAGALDQVMIDLSGLPCTCGQCP